MFFFGRERVVHMKYRKQPYNSRGGQGAVDCMVDKNYDLGGVTAL